MDIKLNEKSVNSQNKRKPQQLSTTAQNSLYSYTNQDCLVLLEGIHKDQWTEERISKQPHISTPH